MILSKNVNDKKWAPKFVFLKVKFWNFLTARHYSNSPNLVISFDCSWFLAKNLSNLVSLPWKLHNQYCHKCGSTYLHSIFCSIEFYWNLFILLFLFKIYKDIKERQENRRRQQTNSAAASTSLARRKMEDNLGTKHSPNFFPSF